MQPSSPEPTLQLGSFQLLHPSDGDFSAGSADQDVLERAMRFSAAVDSVCVGRKFVATMRNYLASVPPDVEHGDQVCIFRVCSLPYILRSPRDGTPYRFIGDTYVEGIMYSEYLSASL
jgi:hypothetical protein